jgi:hypothetical protein
MLAIDYRKPLYEPGPSAGAKRFLFLLVAILALMLGGIAKGEVVTGEIATVGLGGSGGGGGIYRMGCYVPVQVLLTNTSGRDFDIYLSVQQHDLDGDKIVSMSRRFTLNAADNHRPFWFYYWPEPDDDTRGTRSVIILDANKNPLTTLNLAESDERKATGLGPVDDSESHSNRLVLLLGNKADGFEHYVTPPAGSGGYGARGGNATVRFTGIGRADDFPDDVQGLDGVDVIIWSTQNVPVGDMRDEFQLKALLDWVRMGGHLIVTVGTQYAELQDGRHPALRDALPMHFTGTKELGDTAILGKLVKSPNNIVEMKLTQVVGTLAPGAHAVGNAQTPNAPPLLVTRTYGAGTISLLTIDLAAPALEENNVLTPAEWLQFWQNVACWGGKMMTKSAVEAMSKPLPGAPEPPKVNSYDAQLDSDVTGAIDLKGETAVRLLLAVFFLAIYWALAGPVGHVILRAYKKTHWSWWIFGATVVAASLVAMATVSLMRLGSYDLRHRTFVMGTVGHSEAAVVGYYGVFAPTDHRVKVELPEGIGYIAPFTDPMSQTTAGFADPQTYTLDNGQETITEDGRTLYKPHGISFPARTTLKKLEARWYGSLATTSGTMGSLDGVIRINPPEPGGDPPAKVNEAHPLAGRVQNRTSYTLQDVMMITYAPRGERPSDDMALYRVYDLHGDWKPDADIHLEKDMVQRDATRDPSNPLGTLLEVVAKGFVGRPKAGAIGIGMPGIGADLLSSEERAIYDSQKDREPADFLSWLLDIRDTLGPRSISNRVELARNFTRGIDRSATLRASHVLFLAVAKGRGVDTGKPAVRSPLPLVVDGNRLEGDGDISFAWSATIEDAPKK